MVDEVAKPLSIIFEKLKQSGEVASNLKRGNITSIIKSVKRRTQRTTDQSVTPPCPVRS